MTKVYRLIQADKHLEVFCPAANFAPCQGEKCAAWIWAYPEQKETHARISIHKANALGLLKRIGIDGELPTNIDALNDAYEKFSNMEVSANDFAVPDGHGWDKQGEPFYDSDEGCWLLNFTRQSDPTACGFCGLVGSHNITKTRSVFWRHSTKFY